MLDLCLLGTGGMMPLPNRFLTSLYIKCQGHAVLIDCGEGTQVAMRKAGCSFKAIDLICITHFHADHIAGIAGLLLSMGNSGRQESVTIVGPPGLYQVLTGLMVIAPELPFEVLVREISSQSDCIAPGQMQVYSFPVSHRIPCVGYVIQVPRAGRFYPEKARTLKVPVEHWKKLQRGESVTVDGQQITADMVCGQPRKGLKVLYATDTRPVPAIISHGKDADLLILEGMYGDEEKAAKANEWGHMTFAEAASLAKEAAADQLWLTHFSPSITNPFEYESAVQAVFPNAVIGQDGMKKNLKFVL